MFQAAVDRFGGILGCSRSVEVGQHFFCPPFHGSSECAEFDEHCWDAGADGVNDGLHELLVLGAVFLPVGGNHALVNYPRHFHLNVRISGK